MIRALVAPVKNTKSAVGNNMGSLSLIDYLKQLVVKDKENVKSYEDFHGKNLSNLDKMNHTDCFLYGFACGKLERSREIKDLIEELLNRFSGH